MSFGLENISDIENASGNATGVNVSQVSSKFFDSIAVQTLGSTDLIGILVLASFAFILWKADLGIDSGIVILTPSLYFLGTWGWLPGGAGIIYGLILAVGGLFTMMITKYFLK